MAGRKTTTIEARFWGKVDKSGQCWIWTRQRNNKGYGCFSLNSHPMYAHRMSWILTHGEIPDGLNVLHRCDTPACVNPDHLFLGTQLENCDDRDRKNRVRHGSRHPYAKLTEEQVRAIRKDGRVQSIIAADYGVSQTVVSEVQRGATWRRVR